MTFSTSYMVTNRTPSTGSERFGTTPQPGAAFSYATCAGSCVADGARYQVTTTASFYQALGADLATLPTPRLTIFIHGIDTDWDSAVSYTALLGGNLGGANPGFAASYDGLVIGFSWPSTSSVADYLVDRAHVRATAAAFVAFVRDLQAHLAAGTAISVVCHSEGNYLMKVAADALVAAGLPGVFERVLLVAADLPADGFVAGGYGANIPRAAAQVTAYGSLHDHTLAVADTVMLALDAAGEAFNATHFPDDYPSWWPTWERLGTFGVPAILDTPANLYDVDCSLVDDDANVPPGMDTHTAYLGIPQIVADLGQTLSGVAPGAVTHRDAVRSSGGRAFTMQPQRAVASRFGAMLAQRAAVRGGRGS